MSSRTRKSARTPSDTPAGAPAPSATAASPLATALRTATCGELTLDDEGRRVVLTGWVAPPARLRPADSSSTCATATGSPRSSSTPSARTEAADAHAVAAEPATSTSSASRAWSCARLPGKENPTLTTGAIEVQARTVDVLNPRQTPPFQIHETVDAEEALRLRYRYLDLRRRVCQRIIELRHRATKFIRDYMDDHGFLEVETPILAQSTPEGARDFLVPSRVHAGALLRPAPVAPAVQAAPDGRGLRPLLPDRPLLPRRGPARRPPARVHPARRRDVVRRGLRRHGADRGAAHRAGRDAASRRVQRPLPAHHLRRMPATATAPTSPTSASACRWWTLGDLAPRGRRSRSSTTPSTTAAWSKACACRVRRTPHARKSTPDRVRRRSAPRASLTLALSTRGSVARRSTKLHVARRAQARVVARMGGEAGDLLLFVADTAIVCNDVLSRLRVRMGRAAWAHRPRRDGPLLGGGLPAVRVIDEDGAPAMHATHHPFTACNADEDCPTRDATRSRSAPGSTTSSQWLRSGRRQHPHPRPRRPAARLPAARPLRRRRSPSSSASCSTPSTSAPHPTAASPWASTA